MFVEYGLGKKSPSQLALFCSSMIGESLMHEQIQASFQTRTDLRWILQEDVLPVERYDNVDTIEGSWVADEDSIEVL